jgi:protein-tyrosine-phosphatase
MNRAAPLLVIVCTGNICRSPMAAVIAEDAARAAGVDVRVRSAGTSALEGDRAHELACEAVEALGLSLEPHRAQSLTREMVREAALVLAVTRRHRDDIRRHFPGHFEKIVSFDDATGLGDLDDPFGGGPREFDRIAALLRNGMPSVLQALLAR